MNTAVIERQSRCARLLAFACETHPPLTYTLVAVAWSLSLVTLLEWQHGTLQFSGETFLLAAIFFLMLLYLRAVDEIKDLDYDRQHNPSRPLVRGAVSIAEVWMFAVGVAGVILAISAWLGTSLLVLAALEMMYGIGLLVLERRVRFFRETILLNLCVTFPVSAALNIYVVVYLAERGLAPAMPPIIAIVAAHLCIFLHLEFGRKLKHTKFCAAGENGYAMALGIRGAMYTCALFGVAACTLVSILLWQKGAGIFAALPWLALVPSACGFARFLSACDSAPTLKPFFGAAMIIFFLLNIAAVFCTNAR